MKQIRWKKLRISFPDKIWRPWTFEVWWNVFCKSSYFNDGVINSSESINGKESVKNMQLKQDFFILLGGQSSSHSDKTDGAKDGFEFEVV